MPEPQADALRLREPSAWSPGSIAFNHPLMFAATKLAAPLRGR